jgi:hypothetical protein
MRQDRGGGGVVQVGVVWYTREAWERLGELAEDRQTVDVKFDDWERGALAAVRDLTRLGHWVRKVTVDHAARAEYVTQVLQREVTSICDR